MVTSDSRNLYRFGRRNNSTRRPRAGYVPSFESLEDRYLLTGGYVQINLISDIPALARVAEPSLKNPWGIVSGPLGLLQLADNNAGSATVSSTYGQASANYPFTVTIPGSGGSAFGSPTGTVFNAGSGFSIGENGRAGASVFLFATEDGTIAGWNPRVDPTHAVLAVNNSGAAGPGPVYTGLALADTPGGVFLYAANFRSGAIDVFDQNFHPVHWAGGFSDPNLTAGYVPFNVQEIGPNLYVTYTQQNGGVYDSSSGAGNGFVDVFGSGGQFLRRAATSGPLDAPWGVALAPTGFGEFSNDLLVGNFADGHINAFDPQTGTFLGTLHDGSGQAFTVPGLWGLTFSNNGTSDALYFTAGIGGEQHGLFGELQVASAAGSVPSQPTIADALAWAQHGSAGTDHYPLPPAEGPALQLAALAPGQDSVLIPLEGFPLGIVPALLASTAGNGPADSMGVTAVTADATSTFNPNSVGSGDRISSSTLSSYNTEALQRGPILNAHPVIAVNGFGEFFDTVANADRMLAHGPGAMAKTVTVVEKIVEADNRANSNSSSLTEPGEVPPQMEPESPLPSVTAQPAAPEIAAARQTIHLDAKASPSLSGEQSRQGSWFGTSVRILFVALAGYGLRVTWKPTIRQPRAVGLPPEPERIPPC